MAVISTKEPNKKKFPFCAIGHKYAKDVLSGDVVAGIFVKGACKRYLEDLEKQKDFYMDWEAAEKYLRLTQKFDPYRDWETDRKSTRLNSSHSAKSRMPSSA